jgi:ribosome-binding factor A
MLRPGKAGSAHGLGRASGIALPAENAPGRLRSPASAGLLFFWTSMRHKKSTVNRSFRVADQIQRDVAMLIRELKDPRIGMVTINSVDVTPDYAHAQVYFSVMVGEPEDTAAALNEAAGFLRNGLFKKLAIHTVPTLHFHFDKTTERAADLSALIARANSVRAKED